MTTISGKVFIVTGASGGIGAAVAELIHRRRGLPVLAARRASELRSVAEARCGGAVFVAADFTRRAEVDGVVAKALKAHGRIDGIVNCVGQALIRPSLLALTEEDNSHQREKRTSRHAGDSAASPRARKRCRCECVNCCRAFALYASRSGSIHCSKGCAGSADSRSSGRGSRQKPRRACVPCEPCTHSHRLWAQCPACKL